MPQNHDYNFLELDRLDRPLTAEKTERLTISSTEAGPCFSRAVEFMKS